jgi:hypothetical protein
VNALINRIADSPTSLVGRLAARRYGTPITGSVGITEFAPADRRVLIAPVNYSGQGYEWARALERDLDGVSARNMAIHVPGGFDYAADLLVPVPTYHNDTEWQERQLRAALEATHVLIEAEEPPFGRLFGRSVGRQADALVQGGVDVAFLAHGTDVRLPSRHSRDNPWSHYSDPGIYAARDETVAARNIALLERSGRPVFVSTPDLLDDLPDAAWCPVVVDLARWDTPRTERPSGTHLVLDELRSLEAEGVIALDLIQGVPSAAMPARFADADVVIDQLRIGSYGVAACEALAAGCVVVGHLTDRVRARVTSATGTAPPVVEATAETIGSVLRGLAAHDDLDPLRAAGRDFVAAVHDGRRSAAVLDRLWLAAPPSQREDPIR